MKEQIEKEFAALMEELVKSHEAFAMLEKFVQSHNLTIEERFRLKEMLESLNTEGTKLLQENINGFLNHLLAMVSREADVQESSWQKSWMGFVWNLEIEPMLQAEVQQNCSDLGQREVKGMAHFIKVHAWELDMEALKEYIEQYKNMSYYYNDKSMQKSSQISESLQGSQLEAAAMSISAFLRNYPDKTRF